MLRLLPLLAWIASADGHAQGIISWPLVSASKFHDMLLVFPLDDDDVCFVRWSRVQRDPRVPSLEKKRRGSTSHPILFRVCNRWLALGVYWSARPAYISLQLLLAYILALAGGGQVRPLGKHNVIS